jgi:hypothetical protein
MVIKEESDDEMEHSQLLKYGQWPSGSYSTCPTK